MQKDIILYKGKRYTRNPESTRRQHRVYYWRHDKWKEPPFPLHRQIWIDSFGVIPKGFHIHHKDGNTLNNLISNLECISASAHGKEHGSTPQRREHMKIIQKKGTLTAKGWHKSEIGREWHIKHWKNSLGKSIGL